ncbi:hypothetical protein SNE40_014361 [Patella caerulea]|uniref:Tudor domain-containing protein n=1 Tax=Patella caerulea TaxID=87958 RepID=A0AAN8JFB2_PATCE
MDVEPIQSDFQEGDEIDALWPPDGHWYSATILKISKTGKYVYVYYVDDGMKRRLFRNQIRTMTSKEDSQEPVFRSPLLESSIEAAVPRLPVPVTEESVSKSTKTITKEAPSKQTQPQGVSTSCEPIAHESVSTSLEPVSQESVWKSVEITTQEAVETVTQESVSRSLEPLSQEVMSKSVETITQDAVEPITQESVSGAESQNLRERLTKPQQTTPVITSTTNEQMVVSESEDFSETESEYVPDSNPESDESEIFPYTKPSKKTAPSSSSPSVTSTSTTQKYHTTNDNCITVLATNNSAGRKWDKKHYCNYCGIPQSKLPRHLYTIHTDEPEVSKILQTEDKQLKSNLLCKLRNLGNHKHNCEVIRKNQGSLIVSYRPYNTEVDPNDYSPCIHCYGYYVRRELWKHNCCLNPSKRKLDDNLEDGEKADKTAKRPRKKERVARKSKLLKPAPAGVSNALNALLAPMKSDEISRIVKSDHLITELAKKKRISKFRT